MRRPVAIAAVLWALLGAIVWNDVFDAAVRAGAIDYLQRRTRHDQGLGPPVTMDAIMRPAIARGWRRATLWGGLVAGLGLALVALAARWERMPGSAALPGTRPTEPDA